MCNVGPFGLATTSANKNKTPKDETEDVNKYKITTGCPSFLL